MALSREARALRKSNVIFKRGVDPDSIISMLYSKFLLTPEEKARARQKTLSADQQLDVIFDCLEKRVSVEPSDFHKLVQILLDEPALKAVGKKLQALCDEEQEVETEEHAPVRVSDGRQRSDREYATGGVPAERKRSARERTPVGVLHDMKRSARERTPSGVSDDKKRSVREHTPDGVTDGGKRSSREHTPVEVCDEGRRSAKAVGMQTPRMKDLLADVNTTKWYDLGLHLTNDETSMNAIHSDHGQSGKDALKATFNLWLNETTDPAPSWKRLVHALQRIREKQLAVNLEKKYC